MVLMVLCSATQAAMPLSSKSATPDYLRLETGKKSEEIKVPVTEWSYHVYLPTSYTTDRKWPVLFIMSPVGGNAGTLDRYIQGAEMNNWILAVSVQSKNGSEVTEAPITAMVDDVCKRLPIDPKRIYSSGMSGGTRMAFWLSEEMKGFRGCSCVRSGWTPGQDVVQNSRVRPVRLELLQSLGHGLHL